MELLLKEREMVVLGDKLRGVGIICQDGMCWLTQEGDGRDHILRSGTDFYVESRGRIIITASTACRLQMVSKEHVGKSLITGLGNALLKALPSTVSAAEKSQHRA